MRYIRTKDRIIDTETVGIPYRIVDGYIDFNSKGMFKIIDEADILELLFDEEVAFMEDSDVDKPIIVSEAEEDVQYLQLAIKIGLKHKVKCWMKGSIWLEDGTLKPVAELTVDGGWRLL